MFGNQHSATTLGNDAFGSTPRKDEDSDMERSGTSLDQIQTRYSKPRNWESIQAEFSLSTTSETNPVSSTAIAALNMCLQGTYPTIHELLKILLVPTELISCIIHALIPTVTTVIDYCKFKVPLIVFRAPTTGFPILYQGFVMSISTLQTPP